MNFPYQLQQEQPPSSNQALASADYELVVRQQPNEALVTLPGREKNRKPVDPPPIIELKVTSSKDPGKQFLQSPYLFMQCTLQVEQTTPSDNSQAQVPAGQELTGQSVSSLHRLKDINNEDGGFFVFGDISIKLLGKHRLSFSLFELQNGHVVFLKSTTSEPFDVVQHKQWRGLQESSHLSRTFSDQGVRLRLRKEARSQAGIKRTLPYSPRSSTQAGPSLFGYDNDPNKRHRSNDHAPQQGYAMTERAPIAYDPRAGPQSMQPAAYGLQQQQQQQTLLQSPQTSFGSRTPTAPSGWQHNQVFNTAHGAMSTPARFPDSSVDGAQNMAPSPGAAAYGLQPAPALGHDPGPPYTRRSTDSYLAMAHQHPQTSPTTPYQGPGEAMYIPTSGSMPGPSAYSDHDPTPMVRQHTQTHSVASPASSTRSGLIPAATAYPMQHQQLPPQTYGTMTESPSYGYPPFSQRSYQPPQQALLQQPLSNQNHALEIRPQQSSPYMPQSHPNLTIRPQQPGEPYAQPQQQQYAAELGHAYQASGGATYPTTQAPDQSRPY